MQFSARMSKALELRTLIVLLILVWCWFVQISSARAQATIAFDGALNAAVEGSIQQRLLARGIAAGGTLMSSTINAISSAASGIGGSIVASGAVAALDLVGWPALLVGTGVNLVASGALDVPVNNAIQWLFGTNGTAELSGSGMGTSTLAQLPVLPSTWPAVLTTYGLGQTIYFQSSNGSTIYQVKTLALNCTTTTSCTVPAPYSSSALDYTFTTADSGPYPGPNGYWSKVYSTDAVGTVYVNELVYEFIPASGSPVGLPSYQPSYQPVATLGSQIPATERSQPLSDQMIAEIANALWESASAANPAIAQYSSADPVNTTDIENYRSTAEAAGAAVPTVGDFALGPVAASGATAIPFPLSTADVSSGASGAATPPSSATESLCPTGTTAAACASLGTGTASGALAASSVSVTLSPWSIGPASGQCPAPQTVSVFGSTLSFEYTPVCTLASQVAPVVVALCALAAGLIVVLGIKS